MGLLTIGKQSFRSPVPKQSLGTSEYRQFAAIRRIQQHDVAKEQHVANFGTARAIVLSETKVPVLRVTSAEFFHSGRNGGVYATRCRSAVRASLDAQLDS